ncbi:MULTISPECIES: 3'(2'),5'-bisphosphate nucleotidase CysQ [Campylobacter]|mgnify:FL=1|uniref:3'(2'),5'-bisphosphate nucleotidase CysQ family protein n=1 Tax=Campylobacter TaxID=194 RepID=UPI00027A3944|nr:MULTISPECIES: 3'(2'),5'-bisphosphate nucleotidase CysQ [Campylobacter]EJP74847.1 putative 3'(2'),5'-bisphosphate nucleotidase [Campylobacter sp. FOBRC14]MBN7288922.1 3'(2'),5'-bisphosphate nucleotidase CysQ [Campylobacter curvus]MDU6828252.1 3'(2'),5'-bisphosphate nucleotidase CysQ [Campylobacter sp.]
MKNTDDLLTLAKVAALAAGEQIKEHYENFTLTLKADRSPLTSADLAANEAIIKILSQSGLPVCSEEKILEPKSCENLERFWLVDPLDGTKEFIAKNGEFCVCIALIENERPTLGVIFIPHTNELFYASEGGAFKEILDAKGKILAKINLHQSRQNGKNFILLSHRSKSLKAKSIAAKLSLNHAKIGSAIKFCRLAEGSGGVYARFSPSCLWDNAAGDAIVCFSGGTVVDASTHLPPRYDIKTLSSPHFIALSRENLGLLEPILDLCEDKI